MPRAADRIVTIPEAVDAPSDHPKFCRSYVNSYLVNGGVIMPCYGIESDTVVRQMFRSLFPERRVREVRIDAIAIGGGGIHCITSRNRFDRRRGFDDKAGNDGISV